MSEIGNEHIGELERLISENRNLNTEIASLRKSQVQLVQVEKLASVGRMSAGIAHEINNPVGFVSSNNTTLTSYVSRMKEILLMHRSGTLRELIDRREKELKLDFILEDIDNLLMENLEGLERISDIVSNMKKFSREEMETSETVSADINEGIRSALIISRNETKYFADIKTEFGDIGTVECVRGEINQVILNIVINAVQAIREQKRTDKGSINIKTMRDKEWVTVEISDDGPGIPTDVLPRIFDPFFTTKEVGIGTGLGLSISYQIIVEKHGGQLLVSSEPECGTTFTIKLPRVSAI